MNLYLDTEFNGHGGALLSLGLCHPHNKHRILRRQRYRYEWFHLTPAVAAMIKALCDV